MACSLSRLLKVKSARHESVERLLHHLLSPQGYDVDLVGGSLGQIGGIRDFAIDATVRPLTDGETRYEFPKNVKPPTVSDESARDGTGRLRVQASPPADLRWSSVCFNLGASARILLAPAGHGKTYLSRLAAVHGCAESLEVLEREGLDAHDIKLPVWISAHDLANVGNGGFTDRVFAAWAAGIPGHIFDSRARRWTKEMFDQGLVRLYVDSIDEIGGEKLRSAFGEALKSLHSWSGTVWFTSRPAEGIVSEISILQHATGFKLLPLDEPQQITLASKLLGDEETAERLVAETRSNQSRELLRKCAEIPLLLRFMCRLQNETGNLAATTPAALFKAILDFVMSGRWRGVNIAWATLLRRNVTSRDAQEEAFGLLASVAGRLFLNGPTRPDGRDGYRSIFTNEEWQAAWTQASKSSEGNLRRCGVLEPAGGGAYRFPHRQFHEFLVGVHLASRRLEEPADLRQALREHLGFEDHVKLAISPKWRWHLDFFAELGGADLLVSLMDDVIGEEGDDLFRHCLLAQVQWAALGRADVPEVIRRRLAEEVVAAGFGRGSTQPKDSVTMLNSLELKAPTLSELTDEIYSSLRGDPIMCEQAVDSLVQTWNHEIRKRWKDAPLYSYGLGLIRTERAGEMIEDFMRRDEIRNYPKLLLGCYFDLAKCTASNLDFWEAELLRNRPKISSEHENYAYRYEAIIKRGSALSRNSGSLQRAFQSAWKPDPGQAVDLLFQTDLRDEALQIAIEFWTQWYRTQPEDFDPFGYIRGAVSKIGVFLLTRGGAKGRDHLKNHPPPVGGAVWISLLKELNETAHPFGREIVNEIFRSSWRDWEATGVSGPMSWAVGCASAYRMTEWTQEVVGCMELCLAQDIGSVSSDDDAGTVLLYGIDFLRETQGVAGIDVLKRLIESPPDIKLIAGHGPSTLRVAAIEALFSISFEHAMDFARSLFRDWTEGGELKLVPKFGFKAGSWMHKSYFYGGERREDALLSVVFARAFHQAGEFLRIAESSRSRTLESIPMLQRWEFRRQEYYNPKNARLLPCHRIHEFRLLATGSVAKDWYSGHSNLTYRKWSDDYDILARGLQGKEAKKIFDLLFAITPKQLGVGFVDCWSKSALLDLLQISERERLKAPGVPLRKSTRDFPEATGRSLPGTSDGLGALEVGVLIGVCVKFVQSILNRAIVTEGEATFSLDVAFLVLVQSFGLVWEQLKSDMMWEAGALFGLVVVAFWLFERWRFVCGLYARPRTEAADDGQGSPGRWIVATLLSWIPVGAGLAQWSVEISNSYLFTTLALTGLGILLFADLKLLALATLPVDRRRPWNTFLLITATLIGVATVGFCFPEWLELFRPQNPSMHFPAGHWPAVAACWFGLLLSGYSVASLIEIENDASPGFDEDSFPSVSAVADGLLSRLGMTERTPPPDESITFTFHYATIWFCSVIVSLPVYFLLAMRAWLLQSELLANLRDWWRPRRERGLS
jgi:hypothetical protein